MKELSKEEMEQEMTYDESDSFYGNKKQVNDIVRNLASTLEDNGGKYKEVQKGKGVMPDKKGYFVRDKSLKNYSKEDVFYISERGVDILSKYLEKDEIKSQVKRAIEKKFGEGSYDKLPKNLIKDIRREYKEALKDAKESKLKRILKTQKDEIRALLGNDNQKDEAALYEENPEIDIVRAHITKKDGQFCLEKEEDTDGYDHDEELNF